MNEIEIGEELNGGFSYRIALGALNVSGWRKGSRRYVEQYAKAVTRAYRARDAAQINRVHQFSYPDRVRNKRRAHRNIKPER